jgi:hypothetical protein
MAIEDFETGAPPGLPFDWPWEPDEFIRPCGGCNVWRIEFFRHGPEDAIWVREWHSEHCRIWAEVDAAEATD